MLLVHAGNRVDAAGAIPARFPEGMVADVRGRLDRFVAALRPRLVVSAASAGADLLVLEAALERSIAVHLVLPFGAARFRAVSVADRGQMWLRRFDRVLDLVLSDPACRLVEGDETEDEAGFRRGNLLLVEHALAQAGDDGVLALAVRPAADDDDSVTDDFVAVAKRCGLVAIDIDPGVRLAERRTALAVLRSGTTEIGDRAVDGDESFRKLLVPLLEDADLDWARAVEQPADAEADVVVVVDRTGESGDAQLELGLRHATYPLPGGALSDADALDTLRALLPVLRKALAEAGPARSGTRDSSSPRA